MVSLARIGDYEVRMFETATADSADGPLFWMELFNHGRRLSVDSCSCYEIEQAVIVLEGFVSHAKQPDEHSPDEMQS
jgi:hypothetical protein